MEIESEGDESYDSKLLNEFKCNSCRNPGKHSKDDSYECKDCKSFIHKNCATQGL